ncbi:MAG: metallophosphoesterase family protein [Phycisphaerales bacterium]|nr:metallophosphoesterase family protein [Phycisphaerales bacterium]
MARIALISDIHGNREALAAVVDEIRDLCLDHVACLGDIVGYGPDPEWCVETVHELCDVAVLGNHDEALILDTSASPLGTRARPGVEFARQRLDPWHLSVLRSLPYRAEIAGVSLAHGCFSARRFSYLYTPEAAARSFEHLRTHLGVVGHTHLPSVFTQEAARPEGRPGPARAYPVVGSVVVALPDDRRMILNPGAVGQPRDRDPRASWAILDTERLTFEVRRSAYDLDATTWKIRELGLPEFHGERLRVGA